MNLTSLKSLSGYPAGGDPRLKVLALLAIYLVLGITVLGFNRSPLQILIVVFATCALDVLLHRVIKGKWLFPLSAAITGLSVLVPYIGAAVVTIPIAFVAFFQWGWTALIATPVPCSAQSF